MLKIILFTVFSISIELLLSQVSISAIHNKKNLLIKIYTSGPDSLKINIENFKLINYQCFGNVVFLDKKFMTKSGDSIVKFNLFTSRFKKYWQHLDTFKFSYSIQVNFK